MEMPLVFYCCRVVFPTSGMPSYSLTLLKKFFLLSYFQMSGCLPLGSVYFLTTSSFWFRLIDKCVSCPCFSYWNRKILLSFPHLKVSQTIPYGLDSQAFDHVSCSQKYMRSPLGIQGQIGGSIGWPLIWGCRTWGQREDTHASQVSWNPGILSLKFCHFRAMKINVVPDTAQALGYEVCFKEVAIGDFKWS